uniref:NADH-ubiquinone oxidoreductase chain 1 n=1 Tax=Paratenuisentis ambiguus TaxID=185730 RepID=K0JA73_PARAB|nr:NADH dehydrogenase subunit 1 [Paratenuisentis ambiguus]CCA94482.2 NADH dehydrogenase subunit 1 [Paratenuisentis ambiguus]
MRSVLSFVLIVMMVFLAVAYFTMLDRKVLGYGQFRKGPFKVSLWGVVQPLLDGVKLFLKSFVVTSNMSFLEVSLGASLVLSSMVLSWFYISSYLGCYDLLSGLVVVMILSGVSVIGVFMVGLFSASVYSVVGVLRSVAQMVSYEVVMGLILIMVFQMSGSINKMGGFSVFMGVMIVFILGLTVVMEVNRTPVDFLEGESELVSGGVTELGGLLFALMFLAEYGFMAFYSVLVSVVLTGGLSVWLVIGCVYMFSWLRLSLPRFRYDLLMLFSWKILMPVVMLMLIIVWCV